MVPFKKSSGPAQSGIALIWFKYLLYTSFKVSPNHLNHAYLERGMHKRSCLQAVSPVTGMHIQSNLVISKSKGPSKTVRDIRTSTYQICSIEEKNNLNNQILQMTM